MKFLEFREILKQHFDEMAKNNDMLFEVDADKDELYELYLASYPSGSNNIFREKTEHDCSECRSFIKGIGLAVSIKDGVLESIWDFQTSDKNYQVVIDKMSEWVKQHPIKDVYLYDRRRVGVESNKEIDDNGKIWTWQHFYCDLPAQYFDDRYNLPTRKSAYRDRANVFYRSLETITIDATETVLELIKDGSLYRGDEWRSQLTTFLNYQKEYADIKYDGMLYAWEKSLTIGDVIGRIKNHSIGTLLLDISDGVDLDKAVRSYENIVAPSNYKRPKAIYTKKMLDDARKTVTDLGYGNSLRRRFANLDDITVNNVLFANSDAANRLIGGGDLFDELEKSAAVNPKRFSGIGEISIDKFVNEVLPNSSSVEVLLENRHCNNLVSLIAPIDKDAPSMFKWNNPFSWAYNGNIADSDIRKNVKAAGGQVCGDVRFSIQWNDLGYYDENDLDAHCKESCLTGQRGYEIYYYNRERLSPSNGKLDVDIIEPIRDVPAVENIVYANKNNMRVGTYTFFVETYSYRGGTSGFRAEIEIEGEVYRYEHGDMRHAGETVIVAEVKVDKNHNITIKHMLKPVDGGTCTKEIWGVSTNTFIPVTAIMYSPNCWDGRVIGNKHYFFMLDGCVNSDMPNAWYNEYLKEELVSKHKRVFEALGAKAHVEDTNDQLSGIGFSSTKRNDIVVKVTGKTTRMLRIKF